MNEQAVFDALRYRVEVDMRGTRWYYNAANQLHRENGPAIEYADGAKRWYQNSRRHRTDGPAVELLNGHKEWYQYDIRHRTDGPAVQRADGGKFWYINGVRLTEGEFNQRVKLL